MLTEKKRKKIFSGIVAAIMVIGAAALGCSLEEPVRLQDGNLVQENLEEI